MQENDYDEKHGIEGLGVQINTVPEIAERIISNEELISCYIDFYIDSCIKQNKVKQIMIYYQFTYLLQHDSVHFIFRNDMASVKKYIEFLRN